MTILGHNYLGPSPLCGLGERDANIECYGLQTANDGGFVMTCGNGVEPELHPKDSQAAACDPSPTQCLATYRHRRLRDQRARVHLPGYSYLGAQLLSATATRTTTTRAMTTSGHAYSGRNYLGHNYLGAMTTWGHSYLRPKLLEAMAPCTADGETSACAFTCPVTIFRSR